MAQGMLSAVQPARSAAPSGMEWRGRQLVLAGFPVLGMPDEASAVKYFSLNPFLPDARNRCPLACAYCVCHQDSEWHHHPDRFQNTIPDAQLIDQLLDAIQATQEGRQGQPISLCDYSDPFIPSQRERVLAILEHMIDRGMQNLVYITTKVFPGVQYLQRLRATLARPNSLRTTVFVSLPPLLPGYEPVSVEGRVRLLKELVRLGIPNCWYLRPLVEEWYDEARMWQLARELLPYVSHHVVLSSIVMSDEIAANLHERGLVVPAWTPADAGRKQPLAPAFERRVRAVLNTVADELQLELGPVMGHRLCGANGGHAYGCLLCAKQDRYCQLFQRTHYGNTIAAANPQQLTLILRSQQATMQEQLRPVYPMPVDCD